MDRAQRRRDDRRAKAKARAKINRNERYLLGFAAMPVNPPSARRIGRSAAVHNTCGCWMCKTKDNSTRTQELRDLPRLHTMDDTPDPYGYSGEYDPYDEVNGDIQLRREANRFAAWRDGTPYPDEEQDFDWVEVTSSYVPRFAPNSVVSMLGPFTMTHIRDAYVGIDSYYVVRDWETVGVVQQLGSGDWEVSAFPEDYGAPERMTFAPLEMSPEGGLRLIAAIVGLEGRA